MKRGREEEVVVEVVEVEEEGEGWRIPSREIIGVEEEMRVGRSRFDGEEQEEEEEEEEYTPSFSPLSISSPMFLIRSCPAPVTSLVNCEVTNAAARLARPARAAVRK